LHVAAQVLKDASKPMNIKEITGAVLAAGWRTSGKTPAATLYAAATLEIAAKGKQPRYRKVERGLFEHTGVEVGAEGSAMLTVARLLEVLAGFDPDASAPQIILERLDPALAASVAPALY
jgi:hypothetical protein